MTQRPRPSLAVLLALLGLVATLASGCVYRINIQQGNFIEAKLIDQVAVGMTRSQVRFLLGTPMLADGWHPDRWDYLYYFKTGKTQKIDQHEAIIYFADEKVARIELPQGKWKDPKAVAPSI